MSDFEGLLRLQIDYIQAVSAGSVSSFIEALMGQLVEIPCSLPHWLFLARARCALGDLAAADDCYREALSLAHRKHPLTALLRHEVANYERRHHRGDLLASLAQAKATGPQSTELAPARNGNSRDPQAPAKPLDGLRHEDPRDLRVSRLRRSPAGRAEDAHEEPDEDFTPQNESSDPRLYISPLLASDLQKAEFRDEAILAKGGQPDLDDAMRLMRRAASATDLPFAERALLFLEAAKAFMHVPSASTDPVRFRQLVADYALVKSGAIALAFRGLLARGAESGEVRRLRDSAVCYSLEAVDILLQLAKSRCSGGKPSTGQVFQALCSGLSVQVEYALTRQAKPPEELPVGLQKNYLKLFEFCLAHREDNVLALAYESLVATGGVSPGFVPWLRRVCPVGRDILDSVNANAPYRARRLRSLQQVAGCALPPFETPRELFLRATRCWAQRRLTLDTFLGELQHSRFEGVSFPRLARRWKAFPCDYGPLTSVDVEVAEAIGGLLEQLAPYCRRGADERAVLLARARIEIQRLLGWLEETPTYWGRVRFEPLLKCWLKDLHKLLCGVDLGTGVFSSLVAGCR